MGEIKLQPPVKLVCGIFWVPGVSVEKIYDVLQQAWGSIDLFGKVFAFDHTHYYDDEMAPNLKKQYLSFEQPVAVEEIPSFKITSNRLEGQFQSEGKRHVNMDPGYIADAKLVMPTTKNLAHRVYIGHNIFADLQLMYKKNSFQPTPWTFVDVGEPFNIDFFNRVRERYMSQLKTTRRTAAR